MPLTSKNVHTIIFRKPAVGTHGYDGEEVDAFLAEVEIELGRLADSNEDLRGRLERSNSAVLQMARRTAEDHVEDARRDAAELLADAHARVAELLRSSRALAQQTVESAQQKHDSTVAEMESERHSLHQAIQQLSDFRRHYHGLLSADIEQRLPELGNLLMPEPPRPLPYPAG
jgi:DivIVA domain-containing protein